MYGPNFSKVSSTVDVYSTYCRAPISPPQNLQLEFALFAVGGTLDSVKLEEMSDLGLRARALNHVVRR